MADASRRGTLANLAVRCDLPGGVRGMLVGCRFVTQAVSSSRPVRPRAERGRR
ncbi:MULTISPECIES: hypothetical protein [unclassified Streptomyces]|uniref:hypothetical protein n=1 Tax=unclassified Streptomyces TaxID=2593676 RepID=UPI00236641DF|nr:MULTISPECIES: hypothetical protein [unclassified Streptomyces]MDF3139794.1 hypothetical protein [Streptomyces sp. T21Q-yed]WDF42476.1 hypothetical protein PBV52_39615 [Streptomyces sp. T12]